MALIDEIRTFKPASSGQRLVRLDVVRALARHFAPAEWVRDAGGRVPGELGPTLSLDPDIHPDGRPVIDWRTERETVSWVYEGLNYRRIFGVATSGVFVTIRGSTVVRFDTDPPMLHRYVDWLDVVSSMGAMLNGRPMVDRPTIANLELVQSKLRGRFDALTRDQ